MTDMVKVRAAFVASVCVLFLITEAVAAPDARAMMSLGAAVEPPKRPNQFRNIAELNQYLAELRQYYTILGRPR